MNTTFNEANIGGILEGLKAANDVITDYRMGDTGSRQPVHTVYGGAHLFKSDTAVKIGELSNRNFKAYAPDWKTLKSALEMTCSDEIAEIVYNRVEDKINKEALEDFRIDFEDGFGNRSDSEEDETAVRAATEVAKGMKEGTLPPFIGIRIKSFSEENKKRGIRTLDIFLTTLAKEANGELPSGFVVTLPKVTSLSQIKALVNLFDILEQNTDFKPDSLKMEFMVELPETLMAPTGECAIPSFVKAARGRCIAAHFGTYDYTASVNITAEYQAMDHSACDYAKSVMKVALSGTGIWLSDGATNVMPVGPHKGELTKEQEEENMRVIHGAWKLAYGHIRHSLYNGYYQGWDLHPAQIPIRYAALYSFFLESLDQVTVRLKNFVEVAAKATLVGDVFDDAATGQGLLNYFLKAMNCGAISMKEVEKTGLTMEEIQTRSFLQILKMRS
ncbi:MAG: hypothetical protein KC493_13245 [Bacteriovoracaceae bacterium]|nr:hypothetical protein [Bacteriovoracaceae bacterium]